MPQHEDSGFIIVPKRPSRKRFQGDDARTYPNPDDRIFMGRFGNAMADVFVRNPVPSFLRHVEMGDLRESAYPEE